MPRADWASAFQQMAAHADDQLLDGDLPPNCLGGGRVGMVINRFDVFLVNLDPTVQTEIQKTRPCLIISPDELNDHIQTVIIAPMTTRTRAYRTRCQLSV